MDPSRQQKAWLSRISREEKAHKDFRTRSEEVEQIYQADLDGVSVMVPLYWSVVQVEHTGVYSNQPNPDVRPRNEENNPVYKDVARLIERGLAYCTDHQSFDDAIHRTVDDYLSVGLGTLRVKVDSIIETTSVAEPIFGMDPMGNQIQVGTREVPQETVGDQAIRWEYVPWRRIGWEPCNNWKNCSWIYFRHRMTQVQIKKRFGRMVKASKDEADKGNINDWKSNTYDIYEIWDRNTKQVLFIAKGETEPLEVKDDPLGLIDFYPIPHIMMMNLPSEELVPSADYNYIEAYDLELNRLQERRAATLEQIKATGACDAGLPELAEILDLEDGQMLPIPNLMQRLSAAGGIDNAVWFQPIEEKLTTLQTISEQFGMIKAQVDEMMGISDIVRGTTNAAETATAQEIKGRWVGIRLTRKRECVIYTVREMMRIMSQLLASHIVPENLSRMTQMQITEEMMGVLSDDMMMDFVIDIETDSTVAKDEAKDREVHQEMLSGVAQYASSVLPLVQANVMPADTASAILASALKPYARVDRTLSEALNQLPNTQQQLQQMSQAQQDLQGQLDQANQNLQYWQGFAQALQQASTEAKNEKEISSAELNKAKTREVMAGLKDDEIQSHKTIAEIGRTEAETAEIKRGRVN